YDGTRVFREWQASGDTFSIEHTWPHEQVRQFTVRVIRNGQVELITPPVTLHYGRRFNQCGDRQNTLPYNYQPDHNGLLYVSGIPIGAHYRSWPPNTLVYGNFKVWLTGTVIGMEYQPPMYMSFWTTPEIPFAGERQEGGSSLASSQHHLLSCPGMIITESVTDRVYPNGGSHTGDCTPPKLTEPTQLFTLTQRRYGIYGMLEQCNGQYVEAKITALRDVALRPNATTVTVSRISFPMKANSPQQTEINVGGKTERYALKDLRDINRTDTLATGDYIGMYPHGLAGGGAHYAVSGQLSSSLYTWQKGAMYSRIDLQVPNQWKKGDAFSYNMLFTTGGSVPFKPVSEYENIVAFLGLRTKTYPAITKLEGGALLPEPVIATIQVKPESVLNLETRRNQDDPLGLPIRLRGYEPNWQLVYTLNGSKTWRYCGQLDGEYYFHLYTNMDAYQVKMGHPLLADRTDIRIMLDDPSGKQRAFEVYNPTAKPVTVNLHTNPAFLPAQPLRVVLAPYESKLVEVTAGE
ncbi:MAG TPA: hypothetical protein VGM23_00930, partial [Armatimonadota bacterium]